MSWVEALIVAGVTGTMAVGAGAVAAMQWFARQGKGAPSPCMPGLAPVTMKVDLNLYRGTWFEQRRLDSWFESGLQYVTANYAPYGDSGFISVTNTGTRSDGSTRVDQGIARTTATNGVLLVSFVPLVESPYVLLHLDATYQTAVVGSSDRKFLWLLTRNRIVLPAQLQVFKATALCNGYTQEQIDSCVSVVQA